MNNKKLIFIGGSPRSGTSLSQKILDLHSDIYAGPEFDHLPALMRQYRRMKKGLKNGRQVFYYSEDELKQAFRSVINQLLFQKAEKENVKIISEKTPNNVLVFEQLQEIFPDAKFIFVIRDPRGIINSYNKVLKKAFENSNSIEGIKEGSIYDKISTVYMYLKKGEEFMQKNPDQCYPLYYEDLVNDPRAEVQKLCGFLEIPFEEDMLKTNKKNDATKLQYKEGGEKDPFVTNLSDKEISKSAKAKWKKELPSNHQLLTQNFFYKFPLSCLKNYNFSELSFSEKLRLLPHKIRKQFS